MLFYIILMDSSGLVSGCFFCHTMRWETVPLLVSFPACTVRLLGVLADCSGLIGLGAIAAVVQLVRL